MDTRDYLLTVLQDRSVPVRYRMAKLLVCTHDFQLAVNKQELFFWETDMENHRSETGGSLTGLDRFFKGYTDFFVSHLSGRNILYGTSP